MKIPANIFREYDIRGDAEKDLNNELVELIGKAYSKYLYDKKAKLKITVGGDARLSTERIKNALINGLLSSGIDVIDIGLVTTPMLYWSMIFFDLQGGIMITGSHNPSNMNGLKLCFDNAALWGKEIQNIKKIIETGEFHQANGILTNKNINDEYLKMLFSKFSSYLPFKKKFKIVCDSGNGSAGPTAKKFFEMLGCECISIFDEPDGHFPNHHPDPQKRENLEKLIERLKKENADVGFAFDGDADRIGVVDDKGEVIFGDRLMALYWREILKKNPGATAIIEPKCTMALQEEVVKNGGKVIFWKSGHSLIKAKMREINAVFSGEYSGHMFFADEFFGHDDSFYAAGRLLKILSNSEKSLSDLMKDIPIYPSTEESRIPCDDNSKFEIAERIKNKAIQKYKCSTIDGVRINYPEGWGLIRASNTQPVITVRCEAKNYDELNFIMNDIKNRVLEENLPDFTWTF